MRSLIASFHLPVTFLHQFRIVGNTRRTECSHIATQTALRDAALLRGALASADRGERKLLAALSDYEREMIDYGFAAVRASLAQMKRVHATSPVTQFATKAFFRLADRSRWLRKWAIDTGS